LFICAVISFALAAINFGSDVAFDAIVALSNAALVFSYIASIACLRWKRLRGEPLLPRRWDLGRMGAPINDFALAFLAVGFVFSFFPVAPIAGDASWPSDFNWAVVMFVGTATLAMGYYYLAGGERRYVAPVRLVKNE
jgi:amino acid transporter